MNGRSTPSRARVAAVTALLLALQLAGTATAEAGQRRGRAAAQPRAADAALAERLLNELGYWTGPVDGTWDSATRHALVAFQKAEGRERTGRLTDDDLAAIRAAARVRPRETREPHFEVDLTRQIAFFVDEAGVTSRVLSISSGNDKPYVENGRRGIARTPRGEFEIERKISGWRTSPLGRLYYPSYFHKGWAVHGAPSVPPEPASHGCVRVPMYAARELSELLPVGTVILVYD